MRCPQEAGGHGSNNDMTRCHRQFELVGVSLLEFELQFEAVRTSSEQRAWALRTPGWAVYRIRKKCCYSQRNLVSICCSLFSLQLTSHTQPFHNLFATLSNKVWEVYFSKEVCSFVIIVDYVSACICICYKTSALEIRKDFTPVCEWQYGSSLI